MIINYCSGGLGNRLKPFSSCYAISKITNRELGKIWFPTMRCGAEFEHIFDNYVSSPSFDELYNSNSLTIYSNQSWVYHDYNLNSNDFLNKLSVKYGVHPVDNSANIVIDKNKFIIVYSNTYLNGYSIEQCKEFFSYLSLKKDLKNILDFKIQNLNLNKNIIGVHARGTDFEPSGITVNTYISQIDEIYRNDNSKKFFVCSDSKEYENAIFSTFPNNIILNNKEHWVYKSNGNSSWVNNVQTPSESVQESAIDMYLLSKTDFKIYHPDSTFAHIVKMLN